MVYKIENLDGGRQFFYVLESGHCAASDWVQHQVSPVRAAGTQREETLSARLDDKLC